MATTSPHLARDALEALTAAGAEWAFLHGAGFLEGAAISDLDLALRCTSPDVAGAFASELARRGLVVLLALEHDPVSIALFVTTPDLSDGAQLDLMIDPRGCGDLGLRTDVGLDDAVLVDGWRSFDATDSWCYQLRKAVAKHQDDRIARLLRHRPADHAVLVPRAERLFSVRHASVVRALLEGGSPQRATRPMGIRTRQMVRRLRVPAGFLVSVAGPGAAPVADELADRARRLVPLVARVSSRPADLLARSPIPGPAPGVRWRAGVVLDDGAAPFGATVRVDAALGTDEAARRVSQVSGVRSVNQLRRWLARTSRP